MPTLLVIVLTVAACMSAVRSESPTQEVSGPGFGSGSGSVPAGMSSIPVGVYRPLYRPSELNPQDRPGADSAGSSSGEVAVAAFYLDEYPVTNEDYLDFLQNHPRWRRSQIPQLFADAQYLSAWEADLKPGVRAPAQSPVVHVSWFAAKAFCRSKGRKLPTTAQWEMAASASEEHADGHLDPAFTQRILEWYGHPAPAVPPPVGSVYRNLWGVHDLHGLVWEWTLDFNTALVSGESRGDTSLERNLFCGSGSVGAANVGDYAAFMRYAFRASLRGNYPVATLGFRCARPTSPH